MLDIRQKFLTLNKWSRPGDKLHQIRGLVFHWVGNPQTSADFNWRYFESRKTGLLGFGSAHLIIDLDGSILQCMPLDEIAYHAGPTKATTAQAKEWLGTYPNGCTLGIETCHIDWEGSYFPATYQAMVNLAAALCQSYQLTERDIYTHNLITGKDCPKWFVNQPERFVQFQEDIEEALFISSECLNL